MYQSGDDGEIFILLVWFAAWTPVHLSHTDFRQWRPESNNQKVVVVGTVL